MCDFSAVQRSSSKRQNTGDDCGLGSIQIKRHDSEKGSSDLGTLQFNGISAGELCDRLRSHLSTPLPACDQMFPWLHSYSTSAPPSFPSAVSIVRSQPMCEGWIQNSGILRCSMDPHDFLMNWSAEKAQPFHHSDRAAAELILKNVIREELSKVNESVVEQDLNDVVRLCSQYGVLPFLMTDALTRQTYALKKRPEVSNSRDVAVIHAPKQPGSFRRFDIQPSKMVEMSPIIVVYCFVAQDCHDFTKHPCQRCYQLAKVLNIALKLVRRNYPAAQLASTEIRILQYSSLEEIPKSLIGTVPMKSSTLKKHAPEQLVSHFDVVSFNNWDRDLLYREKLEMSKMSSASHVGSSVWCGNSTDYQVYKLLKKCRKANSMTIRGQPSSSFESGSIVKLDNLKFNPDKLDLIDSKFFDIPEPERNWSLMIRCVESVGLPSLEKLWECFLNVSQSDSTNPAEISFPSSGTITLGSLNINLVKIILNTCYIIHRVSMLKSSEILMYCSDGYTETAFLLVSYLIFFWDLPLEEVLIRLHCEYQRPFFLFHMDLQVLGHLQTLLRTFSPKRKENLPYYETSADKGFEPLDITPEMFSKIFLFRIPPGSDFSNLKGPLPSRILPHMYLGSLEHAHSPDLLKKLGINYIVSVGEHLSWAESTNSRSRASSSPILASTSASKVTGGYQARPRGYTVETQTKASLHDHSDSSFDIFEKDDFKILRIMNLGDNGKDTLTHQLEHVLSFIDDCYRANGKVLVHCMVGVSRSATVCIAECMKRLRCDVLRAYLFVRVRRLNVIIQPNLMFMYELLKWQEQQLHQREIDWHILCRSISELNTNYI
ncbi:hypothetical protein HG536_0F01940 [Torulaspora globosa]|uniref:Uncharacterized protein n=1 Tax=Torulaspora globosa TaxID=48254 RepID=A0A7G3ZK33_9SACH|nr:uncharacterized protein HG536_0F01940 [Torulaspora globosa]QLL33869.1 hypothetical protein HG536_0F01940 [Torulaspora globosa]